MDAPRPRAPLQVLVASDLHVDHAANRPRVRILADAWAASNADALVVAGDVSHRIDQVEETLSDFSGFRGPKLFVAGNHDIWITDPKREACQDSGHKLEALSRSARRAGFHCLETGNVEVQSVTFVGTIGWYDYSFADPGLGLRPSQYEGKEHAGQTYMDREFARWNSSDPEVLERLTAGVSERLRRARPPVIFVSHHVPLQRFVPGRPGRPWFFSAYMGSRRLEDVLRSREVTRFIFGHTHLPVDVDQPRLRAVNNPLGYPRESLVPTTTPFAFSLQEGPKR